MNSGKTPANPEQDKWRYLERLLVILKYWIYYMNKWLYPPRLVSCSCLFALLCFVLKLKKVRANLHMHNVQQFVWMRVILWARERNELSVAAWTAGQGCGCCRWVSGLLWPDKSLSRWKKEARNYRRAALCHTAAWTYTQTYRTLQHVCGRAMLHTYTHTHAQTHDMPVLLTVSWQRQFDVTLESLVGQLVGDASLL